MRAESRFRNLDKRFWANVRTIGQVLGYTRKGQVRVFNVEEMAEAMMRVDLDTKHLVSGKRATSLGETLKAYFEYRAQVLNEFVEPRLMDASRAASVFDELRETLSPTCPLPLNKQKGEKKRPQYLTGIVNMLIEANAEGFPCDYDPRVLTTVTRNHEPLRTFARSVDGCFPSCVNPVAIWEIKEYYYTTTFGSRIADGVYETLLDGLEIEELREPEQIDFLHLMIVDAYHTWWNMGKSYLCRVVDMLHMGYVDEVLFGYEVVERLPSIVKEWVALAQNQQ